MGSVFDSAGLWLSTHAGAGQRHATQEASNAVGRQELQRTHGRGRGTRHGRHHAFAGRLAAHLAWQACCLGWGLEVGG